MTYAARECSVVIPSTGRASLDDAVASALAQTAVSVEVVVVLNNAEDESWSHPDPRVRVIDAGQSGSNAARQIGIQAAGSSHVALLDDDDRWSPSKLELQFELAEDRALLSAENWIISCGVEKVRNSAIELWPRRFHAEVLDVPRYLFRRENLRSPRHQVQSSTLFFPRSLALAVPFDGSVRIHMDWDWLIKAQRVCSARILIVDRYLVRYEQLASGITSRSRADLSVEWAEQALGDRPREHGDFLVLISARFPLVQGDLAASRRVIRHSRAVAAPGWRALSVSHANLFRAALTRRRL
ncbi:glycosyltransferase family 2 protein [Nesterenkonia lutea]|uniref:Glycosyltransferase involved in cell wall biosynthesis n=1 Tax=Nesterenkonia lutea TaxID=272919 RepID=A0ABR9JE73_9MICC|nr:glycosyltransferase [Nesterenkonia lutea]MBE1524141.1 glycosyltransferase involved in cell wall biosynthesis [Nesterenkonia lutea]